MEKEARHREGAEGFWAEGSTCRQDDVVVYQPAWLSRVWVWVLGFGVRERDSMCDTGKELGREGLAQAEENRCRPGSPLARDASDKVDVEDGKEKGEAVENLG